MKIGEKQELLVLAACNRSPHFQFLANANQSFVRLATLLLRPDEKPFPFLIRLMVTSQPPSKLNKSRPYRNLVQKMMEELEFDFEWDDYLDEEEEEDGGENV